VSVVGEVSKYNKLDLEVDVCSDLMIKHKAGAISQIHLDYIQQPAHRSGLITFEMGWLSYDFTRMELIGQRKNNDTRIIWSDQNYDYNQAYIDQMVEFVRFVEEGRLKHKYDAKSSIESLKVVESLFESSNSGRKVSIERNERFSF